jgi:hypothetical protein
MLLVILEEVGLLLVSFLLVLLGTLLVVAELVGMLFVGIGLIMLPLDRQDWRSAPLWRRSWFVIALATAVAIAMSVVLRALHMPSVAALDITIRVVLHLEGLVCMAVLAAACETKARSENRTR